MADYVSQFTGNEIDQNILKSANINKSSSEINASLSYVDNMKTALNVAKIGEVMAKSQSGNITGTGIVDTGDKIFFSKDGRFPSGSIDVGPAITLSENGGFTQQKSHTLNKEYILMMYENQTTGTLKPQYWKREAQETNVAIQPVNSLVITTSSIEYTSTNDSQVNAVYLDFVNSVNNLAIEIVSKTTGSPIKYIPNERAWIESTNGINITPGINNVLPSTPISLLTSYDLQINFSKDVVLRGSVTIPYIAVDRQLISRKDIMLMEDFDNVDRISVAKTTSQTLSSTAAAVSFNGVLQQKNISNSSGEILFQNAGLYKIDLKSYIVPTATTDIWTYVERKTQGSETWTRISGMETKIKTYNEGTYSILGTSLLQISVGDKIRIMIIVTNNGGGSLSLQTVTVGAETLTQYPSVLNIVRV